MTDNVINRTAYLAQRLLGDFDEKTGQRPDMYGSIVVYADDEAEAKLLAESMLPPGPPGCWLRIQAHMSGVPDDAGLRQIGQEQDAAERALQMRGSAGGSQVSDYYIQ